eukprot:scaffold421132_cov59-Attheya_sp.AAC.2
MVNENFIAEQGSFLDERIRSTRHYRKEGFLGGGGFGDAFECTDLETNERHAIKELSDTTYASPQAQRMLQSEIDINCSLKHKNVCEYKGNFKNGANHYMVMELCRNKTLSEFMKRRNQQLSVPEVQYFMKQLTDAVSYLHDNSIIHRDLKLDNIFLDETLNVKVGDFGLATRLNNPFSTRTEQCGTLQYMAPEVVGQRPYSFSVDIWSMGVILYKLLVGKLPFQATQRADNTEWRIITNDYSFPSDVHISQDAKDLISSMLRADPDQRPSLYEISQHTFFSSEGAKIPTSLPLSALDQSPVWKIDETGTLVAIEPSNDVPATVENDEYHGKKRTVARRPTAPTVAEETQFEVPTFSQFCVEEGFILHRAEDVPQRSEWSGFSTN